MQDANKWTADKVTNTILNPLYAIGLSEDLFGENPKPIISREEWVAANVKLIDQIGTERWLRLLLTVLSGDDGLAKG